MVKLLKFILPPVIYSLLVKMYHYFKKRESDGLYQPAWHTIKSGNLKGRHIFIDPRDGHWQKEIIDGTCDNFLFTYLAKYDLNNKVIFEIGAHIGYHAMNFAKLVGDSGLVYAFEPNSFNRERFKLILSENTDLEKRISISDVAISDRVGEIDFNFSPNIDDGRSSGSFIFGAHTPSPKEMYEKVGFRKVTTKTIPLDQFLSSLRINVIPYLLKIDVEGAENLVLQGGGNMIKKHKPIVLMEIHSIFNMLKTCEYFAAIDYSIELLKEESDGRCFIAAKSTPR